MCHLSQRGTRHTTFSCAVFIDHSDRVWRDAGDAGLQSDIEYVPLVSGVRCGIKGDRHNCRGTKSPVSFTHSLPVISHSDTSDNDMLTFVISDVDSGALKLPGAAPSESHHYEAQHKLFVWLQIVFVVLHRHHEVLGGLPGGKGQCDRIKLKVTWVCSREGRAREEERRGGDGRRRGGEGTGGGEEGRGREEERRGGDGRRGGEGTGGGEEGRGWEERRGGDGRRGGEGTGGGEEGRGREE